MTKQDYITQMEEARTHSLTKRWNLWVENPFASYGEGVEDCAFCVVVRQIRWCKDCPLHSSKRGCCNGLWDKFNRHTTTENAQAVFDFIKNVDIQVFADKLKKKGFFDDTAINCSGSSASDE